jgi:DNA-binding GntR family transcriptional regulator
VAVSRSASRSVKEQIATELRTAVLDGSLAPGDRLPTEADLIEKHGVARNTARDALAMLVNEGLIVARRPHGYFVRDRQRMDYRPQSDLSQHPTDSPQDVFLTEQGDAGREPSQSIDVSIVEPPAEVAKRLQLEAGALAVVRRRVRFLNGEPFYSNDSYYPLPVAQDTPIMSPHDISRGANRVMAENGHVQVRATDEIYVRMPTPDEVKRLDLAPGTPVAVHVITGYGPADEPLRCVLNVLPGDRHVIIYDRPGYPIPDDAGAAE